MSCRFAKYDKYEGFQCSESGCSCEFVIPNEKACFELFEEGPLSFDEDDEEDNRE